MNASSVHQNKGQPRIERADAAALQPGQPFNPFRLFSGVFVPDVLVRYRGLSPTAKFLWARLARYSENGRAYPSVPTLSTELGLSERQVQRGLAALEREHFIRRDLRKTAKGDYTSTEYVFLWHSILAEAVAVGTGVRDQRTAKNGVVTDVSPPSDRYVTTKIKRRLEEKTSSSPQLCSRLPPPPPPTPSSKVANRPKNIVANIDDDHTAEQPQLNYVSERDELIDLIQRSTGQSPDRRLIRDISEGLELRHVSLREYLDDILPRLGRLKHRAGPGFFRHRMTNWSDARPMEKSAPVQNHTTLRCVNCSARESARERTSTAIAQWAAIWK